MAKGRGRGKGMRSTATGALFETSDGRMRGGEEDPEETGGGRSLQGGVWATMGPAGES